MQRNDENLRNCGICGKIFRRVNQLHITLFFEGQEKDSAKKSDIFYGGGVGHV